MSSVTDGDPGPEGARNAGARRGRGRGGLLRRRRRDDDVREVGELDESDAEALLARSVGAEEHGDAGPEVTSDATAAALDLSFLGTRAPEPELRGDPDDDIAARVASRRSGEGTAPRPDGDVDWSAVVGPAGSSAHDEPYAADDDPTPARHALEGDDSTAGVADSPVVEDADHAEAVGEPAAPDGSARARRTPLSDRLGQRTNDTGGDQGAADPGQPEDRTIESLIVSAFHDDRSAAPVDEPAGTTRPFATEAPEADEELAALAFETVESEQRERRAAEPAAAPVAPPATPSAVAEAEAAAHAAADEAARRYAEAEQEEIRLLQAEIDAGAEADESAGAEHAAFADVESDAPDAEHQVEPDESDSADGLPDDPAAADTAPPVITPRTSFGVGESLLDRWRSSTSRPLDEDEDEYEYAEPMPPAADEEKPAALHDPATAEEPPTEVEEAEVEEPATEEAEVEEPEVEEPATEVGEEPTIGHVEPAADEVVAEDVTEPALPEPALEEHESHVAIDDQFVAEPAPAVEDEVYDETEPTRDARVEPAAHAAAPVRKATPYHSKRGTDALAPLAIVVAIACAVVVGRMALLDTLRDDIPLAAALTIAATVLLMYAIRGGNSARTVHIDEDGILKITQGDMHSGFDLASPSTTLEMVGTPGQKSWRILILRRSMSPVVIDSKTVDPRSFTEALRQWRPDL